MDIAARERLYADKELGCGNFLFKARDLSPTRDVPFLFVERFTTPFGEILAELGFNANALGIALV